MARTIRKVQRNPVAVAMRERYGKVETTMRDRRERRAKDARRKREWFS